MKEINEEIKLTLNLMQTDIDDGAHSELQGHLYSLLEMKRNDLQQRLTERSWAKSALGADKAKPLTTEELMEGKWWCADISQDCANALKSKGLRVLDSLNWGVTERWDSCGLDSTGSVKRAYFDAGCNKQIRRIGNEFYWSKL